MRRLRAYRWNEDGLLGICDRHQRICFALALWNGRDPILKERFFGLSGEQGNHGEDVKEYYFYLDNTPTHSYMKALYKYPQAAFPYEQLLAENRRRTRDDPEYELIDTGVFAEDRYFDVFVEYAKAAPDDILIRIEACNRGPEPARLHVLPTVWFRNTLGLGKRARAADRESGRRPGWRARDWSSSSEPYYGRRWLDADGRPDMLFTENETNRQALWDTANASPYIKDAFHRYVVHGEAGGGQPGGRGTKAAAHYSFTLAPGEFRRLCLRLSDRAGRRLRPGIRPGVRRPHPGSRRVLRRRHAARAFRGCEDGDAPGVRRAAVVEAVLPLRGPRLAERRPRLSAAAARAPVRPQPRMDAPATTPT